MSIGKNIRRLRLRYDLTQEELGKIVGVSGKAISTWEKDISEPKIKAIQILADHFGILKSELVDEQDTPFLDKETLLYAMEMRENPDMQILFRAAQGASKEDLQMAVEMIKRLKR